VRFTPGYLCIIASLLAILGGCDSRAPDEQVVTLRYWNGFTGPDGRTMLALVKRFNQENPDVNVIMQRMEWATYYNKLFVAGLGGRAPDVFVSHAMALPRFVGAGFLQPVDDLLGTSGARLDPRDFDANVLAAVAKNGKHWGIPLDVHPLGMYYNRTLLREAGVVDEKGEARPPTNRAEFLDALRKLKARGHWGFVFTWQRTNCYAITRQFGGRLLSEDLATPTFADPRNVQALAFCKGLIDEGFAPPPQDFDSWIGFRQGRVGLVFEGIYMLPEIQRQKDLDWGAAPIPTLGEQPATWGDSHILALRGGLEGKRLAGAKRFIKFLSDNSLDWAVGGQVPVRKNLRNSDRFRSMTAQSQFARQIPYVQYLPATPFVFEYLREYDYAIELALRGTLGPEQALRDADRKVAAIAERYAKQGAWQTQGGAR